MKRITLFILLAAIVGLPHRGYTEQPQKVLSIVKQRQTDAWYEEQSRLWHARIERNAADAEAWLNYYTAERMLKIQACTRTQDDLNAIVEEMSKRIPDSFEYHYVAYWNGGASEGEKNFHHLEAAFAIAPDRPETYDDFFTHYMVQHDVVKLSEIAHKWMMSNDISSGIYQWCYNMLMSCEPNAVLFTHGDNDTYPALVLQLAKSIRPDVVVMNTSLLFVESYRSAVFKQAGLPAFNFNEEDAEQSYSKVVREMHDHIIRNRGQRPVYYSLGHDPWRDTDFDVKLYNVGLAWRYSEEEFDNIAVIKKNYEKHFMLDYLRHSFAHDVSEGVVKMMSSNYLPSMLLLYNHYLESEDARATPIKDLIDKVAADNNMKGQVDSLLSTGGLTRHQTTVKDPRLILDQFIKVNDTTYAMKSEVSNELYNLFLNDLLAQKRFEDLRIAQNPAVSWTTLIPDGLENADYKVLYANGHPDQANFPAVNMSHEAAELFCRWLSEVYVQLEHRRKPSESATFRLPTIKEWEWLASGGKGAKSWSSTSLKNERGCYLYNLSTGPDVVSPKDIESCTGCTTFSADGGLFTVATQTYLSNDFGLYNMVGNVAEMVSEAGVSKGGSWNTNMDKASFSSYETYRGANPYTGFRVIMIIR